MSGFLSAPTCLWRASSRAPYVCVPGTPWRRSCLKRSTASSKRSDPPWRFFRLQRPLTVFFVVHSKWHWCPRCVSFCRWSCRKSSMSSTLWPTCVVRTAPYWQASSCGSSDMSRMKPPYSGHSTTERLTWRVRNTHTLKIVIPLHIIQVLRILCSGLQGLFRAQFIVCLYCCQCAHTFTSPCSQMRPRPCSERPHWPALSWSSTWRPQPRPSSTMLSKTPSSRSWRANSPVR